MESTSSTKKRGSNFTAEERNLLLKIANKYKNVIENKKTDGATWKSKEEAWMQVEAAFNSCSSSTPRNSKQLKMKYESIKKDMKKKCAANRTYLRGTGGGQYVPPPQPPNEEEKELMETIAISLHGLQNPFDCDNTQKQSNIAISDEMKVVSDNEEMATDWAASAFNCRMLQTPLHTSLLTADNTTIDEVDSENLPEVEFQLQCAEEQKENQMPFQDDKKKDWSSRRRPVLKKKCQKSVAGKFEELALKKQKLIDSLLENAAYEKVEHQSRMRILGHQEESEQIKKNILKFELKIAQFKFNSLGSSSSNITEKIEFI